jgi:hypothetical protein
MDRTRWAAFLIIAAVGFALAMWVPTPGRPWFLAGLVFMTVAVAAWEIIDDVLE